MKVLHQFLHFAFNVRAKHDYKLKLAYKRPDNRKSSRLQILAFRIDGRVTHVNRAMNGSSARDCIGLPF